MDPFWGIALSYWALRSVWRGRKREKQLEREAEQEIYQEYERESAIANMARINKEIRLEKKQEDIRKKKANKLKKEAERRKQKDIDDLRKQGFTDELIAVILPTINNGQ